MFNFLKDKLKDWTKKIAGAEEVEEEIKEEVKEKPSKKKEKSNTLKPKTEKEVISKSKKKAKEKEKIKETESETEKEVITKSSEKELELNIPEEVKEEIEEIQDAEKVKEAILDEEEKEIKEKKGFFTRLKEKVTKKEEDIEIPEDLKKKIEKQSDKGVIYKLKEKVTKTSISEEELNTYTEDLELLLLENNVAYEVVQKIIKELKFELLGKDFSKKNLEEEIKNALKVIITNILVEPIDIEKEIKNRKDKSPYVILFCGINGTGKTTTIAKIANSLQKKGISCVLAGADTFRAASIEQIKKHGEALDIKVVAHDYGSDPASVGFDAISYAKKHSIDCVLIDTAGRMHTEKNLLKEIEKIAKVTNPNLKIFVGESITGNDMIEQAKAFDSSIQLDGIVLTKADIDEKGGAALSIGYITKKPIIYLGTGQKYENIEKFSKEKFIENLGL